MDYYDKIVEEKQEDVINLDKERKNYEIKLNELKETLLFIDSNIEANKSEIKKLKYLVGIYKIVSRRMKKLKTISTVYSTVITILSLIAICIEFNLPVITYILIILFLSASNIVIGRVVANILKKQCEEKLKNYDFGELKTLLENKQNELSQNLLTRKSYESKINSVQIRIDYLLRSILNINKELRILTNKDLLMQKKDEETKDKVIVKRKIK